MPCYNVLQGHLLPVFFHKRITVLNKIERLCSQIFVFQIVIAVYRAGKSENYFRSEKKNATSFFRKCFEITCFLGGNSIPLTP